MEGVINASTFMEGMIHALSLVEGVINTDQMPRGTKLYCKSLPYCQRAHDFLAKCQELLGFSAKVFPIVERYAALLQKSSLLPRGTQLSG